MKCSILFATLIALSAAQYIQDTPEVAAAKQKFAAAFNAAKAASTGQQQYHQPPAPQNYQPAPAFPNQPYYNNYNPALNVVQDTPEVAAAKQQFAAAYNAAAAAAQGHQSTTPQQNYPQPAPQSYPQPSPQQFYNPTDYASQPQQPQQPQQQQYQDNNYEDSASPAAVAYSHQDIPAEPYVHVDIPAEPYVHVEIAPEPYIHFEGPSGQKQNINAQPNNYNLPQQPAQYSEQPAQYPQQPAQYAQPAQSGCFNWKGAAVDCRTDFS